MALGSWNSWEKNKLRDPTVCKDKNFKNALPPTVRRRTECTSNIHRGNLRMVCSSELTRYPRNPMKSYVQRHPIGRWETFHNKHTFSRLKGMRQMKTKPSSLTSKNHVIWATELRPFKSEKKWIKCNWKRDSLTWVFSTILVSHLSTQPDCVVVRRRTSKK